MPTQGTDRVTAHPENAFEDSMLDKAELAGPIGPRTTMTGSADPRQRLRPLPRSHLLCRTPNSRPPGPHEWFSAGRGPLARNKKPNFASPNLTTTGRKPRRRRKAPESQRFQAIRCSGALSDGIARGPHLHFQYHVRGRPRDPMKKMVGRPPRRVVREMFGEI